MLNRYGSLDRLQNPLDYAKYNLLMENLRDLDGRNILDKYKNPEQWYQDNKYREALAHSQADILSEIGQLRQSLKNQNFHQD